MDILVIGPRAHWPAPLPDYLAQGRIRLDTVADLHQAAAHLSVRRSPQEPAPSAASSSHYRAMLVDPDFLSGREMARLCVFKRHVSLPIWSLPSAGKPKEMIARHGLLPWEDCLQALAHFVLSGSTPQIPQGSNRFSQTAAAATFPAASAPQTAPQRTSSSPESSDNNASLALEKPAEMPVASEVAARYDALMGQPVLSEQELRALLGSPD